MKYVRRGSVSVEKTKTDGRRLRRERSRRAVIEASLEVALTSMRIPTAREVAARVGLTERTIFNLFEGKQEIMFATVLAFRLQALERLPEVPKGELKPRVFRFFKALSPLMEDYAHMRWIVMTASETVPDVERGVVTRALRTRVHEVVGMASDKSMSNAKRAALHAAIDPMTWRIYRVQQRLSIEQSVEAMATSVLALTEEYT
ncbi:MAG: hypothetical protein AAF997_16875 [Myxococcota bacterium]